MKQPLSACVSCGNKIPERQAYPFKGHKRNCKLKEEWVFLSKDANKRGLSLKEAFIRKYCSNDVPQWMQQFRDSLELVIQDEINKVK